MTNYPTRSTVALSVWSDRVVVRRPNNTTAYAAGGRRIYGDGADARFSFPIPARPANMVADVPGYTITNFLVVMTRPPADTVTSWFLTLFNAQPSLFVDGDLAAFTDSDITKLVHPTSLGTISGATTTTPAVLLNNAAGLSGRRQMQCGNISVFGSGGVLTPGNTLWAYLTTQGAAYTPLAQEEMWLWMRFDYLASN